MLLIRRLRHVSQYIWKENQTSLIKGEFNITSVILCLCDVIPNNNPQCRCSCRVYLRFSYWIMFFLLPEYKRCFGVCSADFQRYVNPEPEYMKDIKRKQIREQQKVEEMKKLTNLAAAQEQVSTQHVKVPVRSAAMQAKYELEDTFSPFRFVYPEFLPDPKLDWRNRIREKLERIDMLRRRSNIEIPEFYVGS